jgi:hypothetical protein
MIERLATPLGGSEEITWGLIVVLGFAAVS